MTAEAIERSKPLTNEELIAEVEWLWDSDSWINIANRLNYKTGKGIAERLRKAGRNDLAAPFRALSKRQEKDAREMAR